MRDKIFQLADLLDSVFLEPIQFIDKWEASKFDWRFYKILFSFFSSLSIAVGSYYISPPYTSGFYLPLILGTITNYFALSFLPMLGGSLIDSYAQTKERVGKANMMSDYFSISLGILIMYAPFCIIAVSIGLQGFFASLVFLLLAFVVLAILNSRAIKYIYDLKSRDAMKYSFQSLGILFIYPLIFNFYLTSYILNFTL
ncbi:MAG: hypothetical protein O9346_00335 [Leptospiraceae bacterium]|jgi:hypothetical protein|nr:hypothetical protein [Leptospiraceae bacterium]MCZ8344839.1 hypothetical protein [Leptospiraceae bacterium]PJD99430.1 MAG: hypothetical protein CK427_15825 [Leptospira sp.]